MPSKSRIALASLLLGLCACSSASETEDEGRFQTSQTRDDQIRYEKILQKCMDGSSLPSERVRWDQIKYNLDDHEIQKFMKIYELEPHDRVKRSYQHYNDLIDNYDKVISENPNFSVHSANYGKIISIISEADAQVEQANEINIGNAKKKLSENSYAFRGTRDDLKISGVGGNVTELKISALFLKYLYDSNLKSFIFEMDRTVSKDLEYFGNNDIKIGRTIPRIGSPEPVYYAMMLFYAGKSDLKSGWRVASELLKSRVVYIPELVYNPISDLLEKNHDKVEWTSVIHAIDQKEFTKNWICSPLLDVSADWLSLLRDASHQNRDKKMMSDVSVWTSILLKVARTRSGDAPWMRVVKRISGDQKKSEMD